MTVRWILPAVALAILLLGSKASAGPPATSRPTSTKIKPVPKRPRPKPTEYRFDALRIDGTLHGPEALDVRAMTGARGKPLLKLRRSFVQRIFETLEDPSLHGG